MIVFFMVTLAFGQEDDRQIRYQKETEIDFDALELTGEMVKPQGSLIIERSGVKFNPLIELRLDFDPEMAASVRLIK
jgi:hypothetical protein